MANKYKVIIIESEKNTDLDKIVKDFVESISAKKGTGRVAYEGENEDIIKTIDRMLDMEKLSHNKK